MTSLSFVILEDDTAVAELQRQLLEREGHRVQVVLDSRNSVEFVSRERPDILIVDIMMPNMDGLEVVRRLRGLPELNAMKIVVVSAKSYDADRNRALSYGANGMLLKPIAPATFVQQVMALAADTMEITYWGIRGTLPVPGKRTLRYGGNTSCISVAMPRDQFFIFDAGSGIRELSNHLMATRPGKLAAKMIISHPHWDHINALPFFVPLYIPGNEFEIMGPAQGAKVMREVVAAQMDGTYFPITLRELGARVFFRNLAEETVSFGEVKLSAMLLSHPGNCLGYRLTLGDRSFCYVTDNELYLPDAPGYQSSYVDKLVDFVKDTDILLTDTTYTDAEYKNRLNWGHSCVSQVVNLAHAAGVKNLQIMHHDPSQSDDDIDRKLDAALDGLARLGSSVKCTAPVEGTRLRLSADGEIVTLPPIET